MKLDIIGKGNAFFDKTGFNSIDTNALRINGTSVERLSNSGKWFPTAEKGEPIKELYWEKNGTVQALIERGQLKYAGLLPPDSSAKYSVKRVIYQLLKSVGSKKEWQRKN